MKTHVMKRSDREKKAAAEDYVVPYHPGAEDYHYGLRISLDDACLKKLGIDEMPKPGDKFRIEGEAQVISSEQRNTADNSDRRVELVLHELGAEAKAAPREKTIRDEIEGARRGGTGNGADAGRIGARVRVRG
ncbi:MAG TPA: hypothetical protein VGF07_01970 [Stellaceae bacterium]|jgi:hypothetical protein